MRLTSPNICTALTGALEAAVLCSAGNQYHAINIKLELMAVQF